jgi:putative endopeptidase
MNIFLETAFVKLLLAAGFAVFVLGTIVPCGMAQQTETTYNFLPGFDKTVMNPAADPCTDFYQYACGNFAKLHPIPNDLPAFNQFQNLHTVNQQNIRAILEQAANGGENRGPIEQKIGDYYQSCMDTAAIEKAGIQPLQPELDRIAAIKDKSELTPVLAHLKRIQVDAFLDFGEQQDFKDATRQIAYFDQSGLGLPEKDYYFRTDARSQSIRTQYVQHLAKVLQLLGQPAEQAQKSAEAIMKLETELAKVSLGVVDRRDPEKMYHITSIAEFAESSPAIDYKLFLKQVGAPPINEANITTPEFFKSLSQIINNTDLAVIKDYLNVRLADSFASRLPKAFDEEYFDFYRRKLTGTPEQQARWKRCSSASDSALGEALGQVYVAKFFSPEKKALTSQMVRDIEIQMGTVIDQIDWMSQPTKVKAKEKLHLVAHKIGYPNKWRDYSSLEIKPSDALGNSVRARVFAFEYDMNKIGKPVNRDEWAMTPPTVNAYYDHSMNDINFPAGILQPPFYDKTATDATNFGHIGSVVGHELTHGFDDQGRKFDGQGNLSDWWTAEDAKKYEERTECLVQQYSGFTAVDDIKVNGKLTLGENTADNGGLRLALMAYLADAIQKQVNQEKKTDGYTPMQLIFIAWAQNWCANTRPELLQVLARTDPHAPPAVRANGVLVNFPEFATAFGCKKGQPMAPVKQCRVW